MPPSLRLVFRAGPGVRPEGLDCGDAEGCSHRRRGDAPAM